MPIWAIDIEKGKQFDGNDSRGWVLKVYYLGMTWNIFVLTAVQGLNKWDNALHTKHFL